MKKYRLNDAGILGSEGKVKISILEHWALMSWTRSAKESRVTSLPLCRAKT